MEMSAPALDKAYMKLPVQDHRELEAFVQFVRDENIRSYLEIGSKYGGSLWRVARAMPTKSRIVAVDLPFLSTFKRPVSQPYLEQVVGELSRSYDATLILGDSTDA